MGAGFCYGDVTETQEAVCKECKEMELQITVKNIELLPTARSYIERKLGKLNRHLSNITESKVEVSEEKTKSPQQRYLVRATVASSGAVFHGEERAEDPLIATDRVADVLIRQLEHHKGKRYEKGRGTSLARVVSGQEPVITSPTAEEPEKKVVKTKRFLMRPMTQAEAIDEMEVLGHDFFLFLDAEAKTLKLLYRRKDGNFGLIEPEIG